MKRGRPQFLDDYLTQLAWQCEHLKIARPQIDKDEIFRFTKDYERALLRLAVEDATGKIGVTITKDISFASSLKVVLLKDPKLPFPHLKTAETFKREDLRKKAQAQGYDDAITVSDEGYLLEATFGNIFWISRGILYTPSRELPLYFGVTIKRIIREWEGEVREVAAKSLPPNSICFRCSSIQGIVPLFLN